MVFITGYIVGEILYESFTLEMVTWNKSTSTGEGYWYMSFRYTENSAVAPATESFKPDPLTTLVTPSQ